MTDKLHACCSPQMAGVMTEPVAGEPAGLPATGVAATGPATGTTYSASPGMTTTTTTVTTAEAVPTPGATGVRVVAA